MLCPPLRDDPFANCSRTRERRISFFQRYPLFSVDGDRSNRTCMLIEFITFASSFFFIYCSWKFAKKGNEPLTTCSRSSKWIDSQVWTRRNTLFMFSSLVSDIKSCSEFIFTYNYINMYLYCSDTNLKKMPEG